MNFLLKITIFTSAVVGIIGRSKAINNEQKEALGKIYSKIAPFTFLSTADKPRALNALMDNYPAFRRGPVAFDMLMMEALITKLIQTAKLVSESEGFMYEEQFFLLFDPANTNSVMKEFGQPTDIKGNLFIGSYLSLFQRFIFGLINCSYQVTKVEFIRNVVSEFKYKESTVTSIFLQISGGKDGTISLKSFIEWGRRLKHLVHVITMIGVEGEEEVTELINETSVPLGSEPPSKSDSGEPSPLSSSPFPEKFISKEGSSTSVSEEPKKHVPVVPRPPVVSEVEPIQILGSQNQSVNAQNQEAPKLLSLPMMNFEKEPKPKKWGFLCCGGE